MRLAKSGLFITWNENRPQLSALEIFLFNDFMLDPTMLAVCAFIMMGYRSLNDRHSLFPRS
jgi:hypothetical protein